jgi:hypothetical protein
MMFLFIAGCCITTWSEQGGSPALNAASANGGGNMEGKEVRFGVPASSVFSVVSTASSDGAVNGMHDSFTPLASLVQLFNLKTGEVNFGGTGSGIVSMVLTCLVTIFIAGLMVGRTPEYLGKKIEAQEMKLVMISLVATGSAILIFSAATVLAQFPAADEGIRMQEKERHIRGRANSGEADNKFARRHPHASNSCRAGNFHPGMSGGRHYVNSSLNLVEARADKRLERSRLMGMTIALMTNGAASNNAKFTESVARLITAPRPVKRMSDSETGSTPR